MVAGGRRLKAMQALVEDGVLDAGHPVPCLVKPEGVEPSEISLAENVIRIAMHPADQVVAFTKLAETGQSVASIAARFGMSERLVEQRLRLGNAAPELLDAYRNNEIDLEVLKAFAVTTDRERQMAVWDQVSAQGYRPSAWQIKRLLTEERVPGASAVARFVGVEAYEAAGGQVLRDLFARNDESGVWFEDPVLLEKLATEKLQAAADELATRWKWATAMIEVEWGDTARYGRIEPQPAERTSEEQAEIERLEARQAELAEFGDEEWTEETLTEAESIETRLDEIEGGVEARAKWRREDFGIAGCIATIAHDGTLQVIQGLVKPEDMPKQTESGDAGSEAASGNDADAATPGVHVTGPSVSAPMALPKDREAEARKDAGVGIGLADDLRSIRTALIKAHLAGDFKAAFDLMLFQMGRSVFTEGYKPHALDITERETADRPMTRMNDAEFASWSPGEAMLEDRSGLAFDWLEIEDDGESFAALRALPVADKQALFAACVARTVKGQLAFEPQARPELEATVARLDIDFARHVRPTAAMLWSRINKGRILDIARTVFGAAWASPRAKHKKPELAAAMELSFAAGDPPIGVSADMHAAALAWVPPGFAAFDTGRVDEEAGKGDADPTAASVASVVDAGPAAEAEPAAPAEIPADPPERTSVVESIDSPSEAEPAAAAPDAVNGNRDVEPAAPETAPANAEVGDHGPAAGIADVAMPTDVATAADPIPPAHINGRDAAPEPLEIPEFLRRVH